VDNGGRRPEEVVVDRSGGLDERVLGALLDRAAATPPERVAPLVAEEINRIGGRAVSVLLQDFEQLLLVPLAGGRLVTGEPIPILGSAAGRAFLTVEPVEVPQADGIRVYLPLPDGAQGGVLALTVDRLDDEDRRLLRRLAVLVIGILLNKGGYTDRFTQARRRAPMTVAAEIQWSLLPPLTMSLPRVEVAGFLEPAYQVAGDSFDYALNGDVLHMAVIDAMGHGLNAAVMATAAIGAYRHARRARVGLADIYALMDRVIAEQFGPEHFVTAQMMRLDVATGHLQWVNAGHPAPLLIRDGRTVRPMLGPTTLPVGFGGEDPVVSEHRLSPGDRVMYFTDGLVEEHLSGGELFGMSQLIDVVTSVADQGLGVRATVRALSEELKQARGGITSDDATIFLVEWRDGSAPEPPAAT
jgi:hypothetical protein